MKNLILIVILMFNAVLLFANEEHEPFFNKYLWFSIINFSIFIGLLYYFLKKPIIDFFKSRRETLSKEMEDSDKMLKDAEAELEKYNKAIKELDEKIDEIKEIAKKTTEREQQNIIASSEEYSAKIKEEAEKIASQEVEKAIYLLREEISRLSIESAETSLKSKMDKKLNEKLITGLIDKIEVN